MQRFQARNYYKKYIDVVAYMEKTGKLKPLAIVWEDGKKYWIDRIHSVKQATSVVGGCGIRYECMICGKRRLLFYERDRWFMESEKP